MTADFAMVLAIFLDVLMIFYTLWVTTLGKGHCRLPTDLMIGLLVWLGLLHLGLSTHGLFPEDISGPAFLAVIVVAVGAVGALLLGVAPVRQHLLALDQRQLLLMQGIRVLFGANFLMQASLGGLPQGFGIADGWTHIAAGFFGLVAAFSVAAGEDGIRRAWFANIFGLLDILMVAGTLALLLLPTLTPFNSMMYAVFLPAPLWLWFHLVSIWKLLGHGRTEFSPASAGS
jgi:hypothetical protein